MASGTAVRPDRATSPPTKPPGGRLASLRRRTTTRKSPSDRASVIVSHARPLCAVVAARPSSSRVASVVAELGRACGRALIPLSCSGPALARPSHGLRLWKPPSRPRRESESRPADTNHRLAAGSGAERRPRPPLQPCPELHAAARRRLGSRSAPRTSRSSGFKPQCQPEPSYATSPSPRWGALPVWGSWWGAAGGLESAGSSSRTRYATRYSAPRRTTSPEWRRRRAGTRRSATLVAPRRTRPCFDRRPRDAPPRARSVRGWRLALTDRVSTVPPLDKTGVRRARRRWAIPARAGRRPPEGRIGRRSSNIGRGRRKERMSVVGRYFQTRDMTMVTSNPAPLPARTPRGCFAGTLPAADRPDSTQRPATTQR